MIASLKSYSLVHYSCTGAIITDKIIWACFQAWLFVKDFCVLNFVLQVYSWPSVKNDLARFLEDTPVSLLITRRPGRRIYLYIIHPKCQSRGLFCRAIVSRHYERLSEQWAMQGDLRCFHEVRHGTDDKKRCEDPGASIFLRFMVLWDHIPVLEIALSAACVGGVGSSQHKCRR